MNIMDKTKLWHAAWRIEKYAEGEDIPFEIVEFEENIALNTGKAEILNLVLGGSANHFDATNARVGVGDSNTAAANTQTDLQAASNKTYMACDSTWPKLATTTTTNDTLEFKATFGSADANYSWQEFVIKQNTSGICLNRKVSNQGTKVAGQTWVVTCKLQATGS